MSDEHPSEHCGYRWGDFFCIDDVGHDGGHHMVWDGDDDDE